MYFPCTDMLSKHCFSDEIHMLCMCTHRYVAVFILIHNCFANQKIISTFNENHCCMYMLLIFAPFSEGISKYF